MKTLILQGLTPETHSKALRQVLSLKGLREAYLSVAFLNEAGVVEIRQELKRLGKRAMVFAGIRNRITSKQGLAHLISLGTRVHVIDTGSRSLLYHPKLYLAVGKSSSLLLVGSANLTAGGLNNNIEASILFDLDLAAADDQRLNDAVRSSLTALVKDHPSNVLAITQTGDIERLFRRGLISDEMALPPPDPLKPRDSEGEDRVPKMKLYTKFKKPAMRPIATRQSTPRLPQSSFYVLPNDFTLVWQGKPLTQRDLSIPDGPNTHKTKSINLDKGLLPREIDHRSYFRDEVFEELNWTPTNRPHRQEAFARFEIVIKGVSRGVFRLRLGHSTDTSSRTYEQRNAMTGLGWGDAWPLVGRRDLIGRTLSLYRSRNSSDLFVIDID